MIILSAIDSTLPPDQSTVIYRQTQKTMRETRGASARPFGDESSRAERADLRR
jgi:hypothetical protein